MHTNLKKYIKKVVVSDELSTPIARAERLKKVRNMANLSREEICSSHNLNINTYKGWEIARYGGLPIDGAEKIITRLVSEGIVCTSDWLLYGKGQGPYVLPESTLENNQDGMKQPQAIILKELSLLQSYYPNICYLEITDDGMLPEYNIGNFVAGIQQTNEFDQLINKNCIIQIKDGRTLLRLLKKNNLDNSYMLVCTNNNTTSTLPIIYQADIIFAASVARHYIPIDKVTD